MGDTMVDWLFGDVIGFTDIADVLSNLLRDPLIHPLVISPLFAFVWTKLTCRRLTRATESISLKVNAISNAI